LLIVVGCQLEARKAVKNGEKGGAGEKRVMEGTTTNLGGLRGLCALLVEHVSASRLPLGLGNEHPPLLAVLSHGRALAELSGILGSAKSPDIILLHLIAGLGALLPGLLHALTKQVVGVAILLELLIGREGLLLSLLASVGNLLQLLVDLLEVGLDLRHHLNGQARTVTFTGS
jgi:hypothetical protein